MMRATKKAIMTAARTMVTATKRARARVARGMGMATKVAGNKEGNGYSVVGRLYSIQYKSIFDAPDKVRHNTCEEARPSRLDFRGRFGHKDFPRHCLDAGLSIPA